MRKEVNSIKIVMSIYINNSYSKGSLDLSITSHFIVAILIERGAFCVPSKVSRETL